MIILLAVLFGNATGFYAGYTIWKERYDRVIRFRKEAMTRDRNSATARGGES